MMDFKPENKEIFYFSHGLDKDLRKVLLIQVRNLWTHTSTDIEGNTISLDETAFVQEEGLTISGKILKDHEDMMEYAEGNLLSWWKVSGKNRGAGSNSGEKFNNVQIHRR